MSQDPKQPQEQPEKSESALPPKRKRRMWLKVLGALFLLVVILVLLGPTIASTGPVRSIIVRKINESLNGKVEIADWSLGWFTPISVNGIKVYDEKNELVLDVAKVKLGISLLGAIRSNFALGDDNVVDVNSFVVNIDKSGQTNLNRLPKAHGAAKSAASPAPAVTPMKLPDISGKFAVNFQGTIQGDAAPAIIHIDPSTAVVTITDINKPIENQVKLVYRIGDSKASTIETSGSVGAIAENVLDVAKFAAGQKLNLSDVNLAALEPLLKSLGIDSTLSGMASGGIEVKTQGLSGLTTNGTISINGFVFGGDALKGDTFKSQQITIPVNITRTPAANGDSIISFDNVGLKSDQGNITVNGKVSEKALVNLSENKAPGVDADESISITADIPDVSTIANQLKHTLALQEGVAITGGSIHQQLTIGLAKDRVTVSQNLQAQANGTSGGKPIAIQPITVTASASAVPNGKSMMDIRDVKLAVQSSFAQINGGGDTLSNIEINGKADLDKLTAEAGQFADMGQMHLQGLANFHIKTNGDLTDTQKPIAIRLTADAQKLKLDGIGGEAKLNIDSDSFTASAETSIADSKVTFTKPAMLTIAGLSVSKNGQSILSNEGGRGSINGDVSTKDGVAANFTDLSVDTDSKMFSLAKAGNGPLSFSMTKAGDKPVMKGNGVVSVMADLSKLSKVAQSFSGTPASADQPQLTSGQLTGNLTLARADQTTIDFSGQISALTIVLNNANLLNNEQMTLALNAKAPDDLTANPITATGKIGSSFFTTTLSDVKLAMAGAPLEMLQSAKLETQVPDAVKLYAVAKSFMPAPAAGTSPLEVTSGSATVNVALSRDAASKTTTVNVTDTQISKLALRRGKQVFAFDGAAPISLKLAAAVQGTDKVQSVKVQELSGDVRVASLTMPVPIEISGFDTPQPLYKGSVGLAGKIESVTPLLAVVQGQPEMGYGGSYVLTQKLGTSGGVTQLAGSIDINDFRVLDDKKKAVFTEPQVAIRNDLGVDLAQHKVAISVLTLDMPKSQAVKLSFTGGVNAWEDKRVIRDGTKLDVTYDWAKLWTIARPMLSPEQQASYKDLKIEGKYQKTFALSGAFPAVDAKGKPLAFNESIKSLNAEGGLAIDLLDTSGLTIQKLSPQVKMTKGIVTLSGTPAVANSGSIAFAGIVLDMTQPQALLTVPKNTKLLQDVKLNPVLAGALGKLGAVIFTDASRAEGALNLTVVNCDRLPLGELSQQKKDFDAGITLSVENLILDGPVPSAISVAADLGTDGIHGSIPPSTVTISKGVAQTKLIIQVDRAGTDRRGAAVSKPIQLVLAGGMVLDTLQLQKFMITIPPELILASVRQYLPNGAVIALKGAANKPKLDLDTAIKENIGKSILGGQGGDSPVGDLLKGLGGGNNDRQPRQRNQGQ